MKSVNFEFLQPENNVLANLGGFVEALLQIYLGCVLTRLRSFDEELTKAIYNGILQDLHELERIL